MDDEVRLTALIARYPNRWAQAVANPSLRGWFINRMTALGDSMANRILAAKAIDQRAANARPGVLNEGTTK
jgi:hypothetical protein